MSEQSMWSGDSYDYLMGRWSQLMAPSLVAYSDVQDGDAVLDVGCGTGSLTSALLAAGPNVRVTGIDGAEAFIEISRSKIDDERASFDTGDAQSLQFADDSFDKCMSLLVMNFVPDASQAVAEMKRVTKSGGTICAAVWDYSDGMQMLRHLWDEAASIDSDAVSKHEGNMPLCREGELAELWRDSGLADVSSTGLTVKMNFASFDDYWSPFLTGVGPSGAYVCSLEDGLQAQLRERLIQKLSDGDPDALITLTARAWAVKGKAG